MSVPGLERGIAILRLFRRDRTVLTAPEIARELAIPRSTVHRLLIELVGLGLLRRETDGRFALDAGVLTLGFEYLASLDIVALASPVLEALRDATNWSTHLAVRQGRSITYLARFASRAAVTRNVAVGSSLPAHATLMGRLLLSDLEPTELNALYEGVALERITPETPTDIAALRHMIQQDHDRGYAASGGFYEPGVRTIAAPIRDAKLNIVAAINGTAIDDSASSTESAQPLIVAAAARISRLLGAPESIPVMSSPIVGERTWG